ncbi:MAG: hypothetical protein ACOX2X_03635 [Peptococcia bacterium]|jgi:hypothetical protein
MEGLKIAYNLSGAVNAVWEGRFVVLVDVIDMSTTLETIREAGGCGFWGAAPSGKNLPYINPYSIGRAAAREAKQKAAKLVVITEPRSGPDEHRRKNASAVLAGFASENMEAEAILPNMGAETARLLDWRDKVAVAVTDAGGVIFDAVFQLGGSLTTATVARTIRMKGTEPARAGIKRALAMAALAGKTGITLVAASSNALEDVLAVQYLAQLMINEY